MAALLVFAVAAHRQVRRPGENSQKLDVVLRMRRAHLGFVAPGKSAPVRQRLRCQGQLHRCETRGEVWKPDIVPVLRGELAFRHPARRASHRSHAHSLACNARRSQTDYMDAHWAVFLSMNRPHVKARATTPAGAGLSFLATSVRGLRQHVDFDQSFAAFVAAERCADDRVSPRSKPRRYANSILGTDLERKRSHMRQQPLQPA